VSAGCPRGLAALERRQPTPGLARRFAAIVYDALLVFSVLYFGTLLLMPFTGGEPIAPGRVLYQLYLLGLGFLYFGWCWTHGGQTLGMRAWRLRLRGPGGAPPGWGLAALRFAAAFGSWAALGLGFLWALRDTEGLTWHDRVSRTTLVVLPKADRS